MSDAPVTAPVPADEEERIEALHALGLLGQPPQERFDRIARIAARTFGMPIALVTFVDRERQFFMACLGLGDRETPRTASFCAHTLADGRPLVIRDTHHDVRFVANLLVTGPPHLRFYAGRPIAGPTGHRLGTLCVADTRPREFGPDDLATLHDLAHLVELELGAEELGTALQARRDAEGRLRSIVDAAAEGIVTVDAERRIVYANPAAGRIVGLLTAEAVGLSLDDLLVDAGARPAGRSDAAPEELFTHEGGGSGIAELRRFDSGLTIPVEFTAAPTGEGGRVVTFRDIGERWALEDLRRRFVGSVSHELRTPLAGVVGYLEGLAAGDAGDLAAEQTEYVEGALRGAERLRSLLEDLLTLTELDGGARQPATTPVDLLQMARDVAAEGSEDGIRVEVEGTCPGVLGDPSRIRQMLENLIGNAVKYSPPGGRVIVRTDGDGRGAILAVEDQGPGVPEGELPDLGKRFYRASSAGDTAGTGLGLSIVKEIAAQHGGGVNFENLEAGGFRATLRLPERPPTA